MLYKAHKCMILSADDDPDDQLFMQDAFAELDLNCETIYFPNGQELINYVNNGFSEVWEAGVPCMIYLDLNMPQLNGKETLRDLRSRVQFYGLPVFILSTSAGENDIEECYELGANAVFQKPHEFSQFKNLLQGAFNYWMPFLLTSSHANAIAHVADNATVII